jgi:hypothetical protein
MPVIGFINPASPVELANRVSAFRNGLAELGFVEGRNVMIEYRWAEGRYDQLPALANDLVGREVAAIAATGGIASARAARLATADVPIVFTTGTDPVEAGLVMSLNRPGGNVTGAGLMSAHLVSKRLEILRELIPNAKSIAVLAKADNPSAKFEIEEAQNRPTGPAGHKDRTDHQRQDRHGARGHLPTLAAGPRRRGDRMRKADDPVHRTCRVALGPSDPRHGRQRGSACGQM